MTSLFHLEITVLGRGGKFLKIKIFRVALKTNYFQVKITRKAIFAQKKEQKLYRNPVSALLYLAQPKILHPISPVEFENKQLFLVKFPRTSCSIHLQLLHVSQIPQPAIFTVICTYFIVMKCQIIRNLRFELSQNPM